MSQESTWRQFSGLPAEAKKQVIDFIAFLQTRRASIRPRKTAKSPKLEQEAFVGMWRNREDLRDSSAWVRAVREREWGRP